MNLFVEVMRDEDRAIVRISTGPHGTFLLQIEGGSARVVETTIDGTAKAYRLVLDPHQNRHLVAPGTTLPAAWRAVDEDNETYYREGRLLPRYWKLPLRSQTWLDDWPRAARVTELLRT